jgi:hypothetical protein
VEEEERRKRALMDLANFQGWSEKRIAHLKKILQEANTVDEAGDEFRKLRLDIEKKVEVRVVHDESLMIEYLQEGWELMRELDGDRYLLRKLAE